MTLMDPSDLDRSGAWLLDKIADGYCHYYFCKSRGSIPVTVGYTFEINGRTVSPLLDALVCPVHVGTAHKYGDKPSESRKTKVML